MCALLGVRLDGAPVAAVLPEYFVTIYGVIFLGGRNGGERAPIGAPQEIAAIYPLKKVLKDIARGLCLRVEKDKAVKQTQAMQIRE